MRLHTARTAEASGKAGALAEARRILGRWTMNAYVQVLYDAFNDLGLLDDELKRRLQAGKLPHIKVLNNFFGWRGGSPSKARRPDLCHFYLVVRKMSELIKDPASIIKLPPCQHGELQELQEYRKLLSGLRDRLEGGEPEEQKKCKRHLLWAAFYHDIGKAIERARHGAEGADMIKDSHAEDRALFQAVGIDHTEIFRLAGLIRFHDYFGVLATGEASYLLFMEVFFPSTNPFFYIEPLRDALSGGASGAGGQCYEDERFFDHLFLLNVADIAASVGVFTEEKALVLMHDYARLYPRIRGSRRKARYLDVMAARLQEDSVAHTFERIRRLLREGVRAGVRAGVDQKPGEEDASTRGDARVHFFAPEDIQPVIRTLAGLNLPSSFYDAFASTAKLDYGLTFVKMLAANFVDNMHRQYLEDRRAGKGGGAALLDLKHDYRHDMASTLIRLLVTILSNYGPLTESRTRIYLEFKDLNDRTRTNPELLRRMTGMAGNFKQQEAFKKALDSVFIWKANP